MRRHALLRPSGADRWLTCPPSARFEEHIPDTTSPYAEEGSLAHELAALILEMRSGNSKKRTGLANASLDWLTSRPLYTDEMLAHCESYAAFVTEVGGDVLIEHTYDLSAYIPTCHGTADATVFTKTAVHVIDFKYGAGVRVSATANKQLMLYALGAYEEAKKRKLDPKIVVLSIFQPRIGAPSSWEIPAVELLKWAEEEANQKAILAIAGDGEFAPGKHCRFCKAQTRCGAFYKHYADLKIYRDKRELHPDEIRELLTFGPTFINFLSKLEKECTERLKAGESIPGFKLVNGRGRRAFKNEDDVVDILLGENYESDKIFDSSLISLTAIEKLVGKKRFNELFTELIIKVPGAQKLATTDDERADAGASAADEFDEVDLT